MCETINNSHVQLISFLQIPGWALLFFGFGLFIYQTLDAADGKQARRTGTSSPLGELFDHGCDSVSTLFVSLATCLIIQLGHYPGWIFYFVMMAVALFYIAHWQTYVSSLLRFGRFDVTEVQFIVMFFSLITTLAGQEIWSYKVILIIFSIHCTPTSDNADRYLALLQSREMSTQPILYVLQT